MEADFSISLLTTNYPLFAGTCNAKVVQAINESVASAMAALSARKIAPDKVISINVGGSGALNIQVGSLIGTFFTRASPTGKLYEEALKAVTKIATDTGEGDEWKRG